MKKISFILTFLLVQFGSEAQNWQSLGGGTNFVVRELYADTLNDKLLIGGSFSQFGDSIFKLAVIWDGNTFAQMGTWGDSTCILYGCNPVLSFQNYNGTYFAAGTFNLTNLGSVEKYIVKWNGSDWDTTGNPDGPGLVWEANNEFFYLGLGMSEISGQPCKDVARWNGTYWEPFYTVSPNNGEQVWCMSYYQGKYIFAGNFSEPGGLNDILAYDGIQTYALGNGFVGGICGINDMVVYKGLLWVGGYFYASDGNVNDFIAAWDGQNWIDPFPDVYYINQVFDLDVIDDVLYITGHHILPNDTASYGIAHYDGINFCSFGGPAYYPEYPDIRKVEGLNGRLYVTCNRVLFGDTVNYIAEYIGTQDDTCLYIPLAINENVQNEPNAFQVFPNPSDGSFLLSFSSNFNFANIKIYDALGRLVYSEKQKNILQGNTFQLEIPQKIPGLYLLSIETEKGVFTSKLLVSE